MNVSIVMPIYNPNKEILKKIEIVLKKQKFNGKVEIIKVDKGLGLAESLNYGIKKAKHEIIVSLHQDCIPSDEYWLKKLIDPFRDKEVILTVSKVHLPKKVWKNFGIFTRALTLNEKGTINPSFDEKGCAYRKKTLENVGLFNEKDFRTAGEDADMDVKLKGKGKIVYPDCTIIHMHYTDFKKRLKKTYQNANGYGTIIRLYGTQMFKWHVGVLKAIPLLGIFAFIFSYSFKKGIFLFPFYFICIPLLHFIYLLGFWKGFLNKKQTI